MMKKIFAILLLAFAVTSCDIEGDNDNTVLELGMVEEFTMPERFKVDSISRIMIRYTQPSACHIFNGFYYEPQGNMRTVAIEFLRLNESNCNTEINTDIYEVSLNFRPLSPGTYLFKFWTGVDENGNETFTQAEAVVPQ